MSRATTPAGRRWTPTACTTRSGAGPGGGADGEAPSDGTSTTASTCSKLREMMERVSMIQEKFDCPALIEEFIEGREIYVGVIGNDKPAALPVVELDLSKLPEGMPRIAGKEVKWDKGSEAYESAHTA